MVKHHVTLLVSLFPPLVPSNVTAGNHLLRIFNFLSLISTVVVINLHVLLAWSSSLLWDSLLDHRSLRIMLEDLFGAGLAVLVPEIGDSILFDLVASFLPLWNVLED